MTTKKVWTDEEKRTVAAMKRAGLTAKQIAERFGVTPKAVNHQAQAMNATRRLDRHPGRAHRNLTGGGWHD